MNQCKDIEKHLPLYDEGLLSDREQKAVEEHLAVCADCRRELSFLRKTIQIMGDLSPLQEPAWFQQKMMARVRAEGKPESFLKKYLAFLRRSLPVQIMAGLVLAVLSVYVYRAGDEEAGRIVPQVARPALEMPEEKTAKQDMEAASGTLSRPAPSGREISPPARSAPSKSQPTAEEKIGDISEKNLDKRKNELPREPMEAPLPKKDSVAETMRPLTQNLPSAPQPVAESGEKIEERKFSGMAKSRRDKSPASPSASVAQSAASSQAYLFLQVPDAQNAAREVEKILAENNAENVLQHSEKGFVRFTASLPGATWPAILSELRKKGAIREMIPPAADRKQNLAIVIEISAQP